MTDIKITTRMLYDLSNVNRWTAIRTIRRQNVAEHTFGVMVACQWLNDYQIRLTGDVMDPMSLLEAYQLALKHDGLDSVIGDMQGPFKHKYMPELSKFEDAAMGEYDPLVVKHVKLADKLEQPAFLHAESAMGNNAVDAAVCWLEERAEALGADRAMLDAWYAEFDFYTFPVMEV